MEQSRGIRRLALIAGAAVVIAALGVRLAGGRGAGAVPGIREPEMPELVARDERVLAEVLNGSGRRGLARLVTRLLRKGGLDVVYFGTASGPAAARTEVLVRRGTDTLVAARVARALGAGAVRVAPAPDRRVDLTILIGEDYRAPRTSHP